MAYKKTKKVKQGQFRKISRNTKKTKKTQRGRGNVSGKTTPAPDDFDLESRITQKEQSRRLERPSIITSFSLDDYDIESATPTPKNESKNRNTFSPTPFGSRPTTPLTVGTSIIQTTPTRPGKKSKSNEELDSYQIKIEEDVDLDTVFNNDDVIFEDLKKRENKEKMKDIVSQAATEASKRKEDKLTKKAFEWNTEFDNLEKRQEREDVRQDWKQRQKVWEKNKQMKDLTAQEKRERLAAESADATAREVVWENAAERRKFINKRRGNRWWANTFDKDRKNKGGKTKKTNRKVGKMKKSKKVKK
jgi:hypothetical protein